MTAATGPLLRRIGREHRRTLLPLLVALVANVLAYALVVYPLADKVANIEQREAAAADQLAAARREHTAATGTLTGKDRAARELDRFYAEVLPRDLQASRRLTHVRLAQLAGQLGISYDSYRMSQPKQERDSTLTRVQTLVEVAGRYRDIRTFIHQLETSPEFVVIDSIKLAEEDEETGVLSLSLEMSTYYRTAAP
jgi:Tfp pilus assembly protein PilO